MGETWPVPSRADLVRLADDLVAMRALIEEGALDSTPAMRHRIEGAIAALEVALGRSPRSALGLPQE